MAVFLKIVMIKHQSDEKNLLLNSTLIVAIFIKINGNQSIFAIVAHAFCVLQGTLTNSVYEVWYLLRRHEEKGLFGEKNDISRSNQMP